MNKKISALVIAGIFLISSTVFAAEQVFFYHTDPAGTPLAMTNASGSVVWKADYKPFGEENTVTSTQENDKRFVGKEKDEETGLYYFGARYMEPNIGRFAAVDPIGAVDPHTSGTNEGFLLNPQRLNQYAYGLNNPYRYVDKDGNIAWPLIWDYADVGFFGYSVYKFTAEPSWSNAGDMALDTVGVLPIIPSIGSIKLVGKGLSKVDEAIEGAKFLNNSWYKSTFPNKMQSIKYHWKKHAEKLGKSLDEYTKDALDFFENNKRFGQKSILEDGTEGILIRKGKGQPGGYFTPEGKIVTFWYK